MCHTPFRTFDEDKEAKVSLQFSQWLGAFLRSEIKFIKLLIKPPHHLLQGSSNLSLEGQSATEFSSNPDQTHLPVIF